ncbi:hypothetical protein D1007_28466 [Hordeum vulgare]|nr:hypothetical protein D1007_28466 [Hordeum vulgare]
MYSGGVIPCALLLLAVREARTPAGFWSLPRVRLQHHGACSVPLRTRFNVWGGAFHTCSPPGGERQYLASGWRQLDVVVNLGRLQREGARGETEASLAVAVEARERALAEAHEADCRRRASEDRHRELCALIARLEEQAPPRASLGGPPAESFHAGPRASADLLVLVAVEQCLELERLETRECQLSLVEETLASH